MSLHADTSPETSNLTQTGGMLDSLFYKVNEYGLQISVRGAQNLLKAIYTSVDRPWANISAEEAELVRKLLAQLKP